MLNWLFRALGFGPSETPPEELTFNTAPEVASAAPAPPVEAVEVEPGPVPCPSCAVMLDPPPARSRRCPYCREMVVVRRVEGRAVYFTEQAVAVFEAQRQRELDEARWSAAREQWLLLARNVGASPDRRTRLAAMPISEDVVAASRRLYTTSAARRITDARREKRWGDVGQLARDEAMALYRDAGSPVPVPEEILARYREGMTATLRSLVPIAKDVELVSAECCPACRADEGQTFKTTDEVKGSRLPHEGCPKGLCGCDWWPAVVDRKRRRKRRTAAAPAAPTADAGGAPDGSEDAAAADHPGLEGGGGDHVPAIEERERVSADDPPVRE